MLADRGERAYKLDLFQRSAPLEGCSADRVQTVSPGNAFQRGNAPERLVADGRERISKFQFLEGLASVEGVISDALFLSAEGNGLQILASAEGAGADLFDAA